MSPVDPFTDPHVSGRSNAPPIDESMLTALCEAEHPVHVVRASGLRLDDLGALLNVPLPDSDRASWCALYAALVSMLVAKSEQDASALMTAASEIAVQASASEVAEVSRTLTSAIVGRIELSLSLLVTWSELVAAGWQLVRFANAARTPLQDDLLVAAKSSALHDFVVARVMGSTPSAAQQAVLLVAQEGANIAPVLGVWHHRGGGEGISVLQQQVGESLRDFNLRLRMQLSGFDSRIRALDCGIFVAKHGFGLQDVLASAALVASLLSLIIPCGLETLYLIAPDDDPQAGLALEALADAMRDMLRGTGVQVTTEKPALEVHQPRRLAVGVGPHAGDADTLRGRRHKG